MHRLGAGWRNFLYIDLTLVCFVSILLASCFDMFSQNSSDIVVAILRKTCEQVAVLSKTWSNNIVVW